MLRKRSRVILYEILAVFACSLILTYLYRNHGWSADRGTAAILCGGMAFLLANFLEDLMEIRLLPRVTERGRRSLYLLEFVMDLGIFFLGAVCFSRVSGIMASFRTGIIISTELAVIHFMLRKLTGQLRPKIVKGDKGKCKSTKKTS